MLQVGSGRFFTVELIHQKFWRAGIGGISGSGGAGVMQMASSFRVTPQTGWPERGCSCRNNTSVVGCDTKLPCSLWLWHGFSFVVPSLSGAERKGKLPSNACTGSNISSAQGKYTSLAMGGQIGWYWFEATWDCKYYGAHSSSIITDQKCIWNQKIPTKYIEIHLELSCNMFWNLSLKILNRETRGRNAEFNQQSR